MCGLSLVAANKGYSLVEVCGFPIMMASLVVDTGSRVLGLPFYSCGGQV